MSSGQIRIIQCCCNYRVSVHSDQLQFILQLSLRTFLLVLENSKTIFFNLLLLKIARSDSTPKIEN